MPYDLQCCVSGPGLHSDNSIKGRSLWRAGPDLPGPKVSPRLTQIMDGGLSQKFAGGLILFQAEVCRPEKAELRSAARRAAEVGGQLSRPRQLRAPSMGEGHVRGRLRRCRQAMAIEVTLNR